MQSRERHTELLALSGRFNAIHLEQELLKNKARERGHYTRLEEEKLVTLGNAHRELISSLESIA